MVRCDVNVSVRPGGRRQELGAKIEIKNMNSFSGVRRALEYEIPRQIEVVTKGGKLIQSTRRWDDVGRHHRGDAHQGACARLPLFPGAGPDAVRSRRTEWLAEVRARVVELPLARKQRFMRDYQLPPSDAADLRWDVPLGDYFEGIARQAKNPKAVANWVINNLRAKMAEAREKSESGPKPKWIKSPARLRRCRAGGPEVQAGTAPGTGGSGRGQDHQQCGRAGGLCRDVRHRQTARGHRRGEGPGAGERHRRHREVLR